jgi:chromosome segregation ATPase
MGNQDVILNKTKESILGRIESLKEKISFLSGENNKLTKSYNNLSIKHKTSVKTNEELKDKIEISKDKIKDYEKNINLLNKEIDELKNKLGNSVEENDTSRKEIEELMRNYSSLSDDKLKLEENVKILEEKLDKNETEKNKLSKTQKELEDKLDKFEKDNNELNSKLSDSINDYKKIKTEFDEKSRLLNEIVKMLEDVDQDSNPTSFSEPESIKDEIKESPKTDKEIIKKDKIIKELEDKIKELKKEIEESISVEIPTFIQPKNNEETSTPENEDIINEEIEELSVKVRDLERDKYNLEKKMDEVIIISEENDKLKKELDEKKEIIENAQIVVAKKKEMEETVSNFKDKTYSLKNELNARETEHEKLKNDRNKIFEELQAAREKLNTIMNSNPDDSFISMEKYKELEEQYEIIKKEINSGDKKENEIRSLQGFVEIENIFLEYAKSHTNDEETLTIMIEAFEKIIEVIAKYSDKLKDDDLIKEVIKESKEDIEPPESINELDTKESNDAYWDLLKD